MVKFSERVLNVLLSDPPYDLNWWMNFYAEALNRPGLLACLHDDLLVCLKLLNERGFVYVQKMKDTKQ